MDKAKHIILKSYMNKDLIEVGLDEAGRGALAGPVVVAAVIMPKGFTHPLVKDSKLLNEGERREARKLVLDNAVSYSIKAIVAGDINQYDIQRNKVSMPKFYNIIKTVKGVGEHVFTEKDIVRAKILIDIVKKYDAWKDNEGR